jgi:hypothetical protein
MSGRLASARSLVDPHFDLLSCSVGAVNFDYDPAKKVFVAIIQKAHIFLTTADFDHTPCLHLVHVSIKR